MRIPTNSYMMNLVGFASHLFFKTWSRSLNHRIAYYDPMVDPLAGGSQEYLFLLWHEYMTVELDLRSRSNLKLLVSQHRDGEFFDRTARRFGFGTVRGSSRRGATAALKKMIVDSNGHHLVMTPDGPRGPRRRMEPGAVYLASKLQRPIVCLGVGYDRPWRMNSWDRFAMPRPFSRVRQVLSPALTVPPNLKRDELEAYRVWIEDVLNTVTLEAEAWAESRTEKPLSMPALRRRLPPMHPFHSRAAA